jgi:diguanylate cyclase (GGDEF)-like protein
MLASLRDSLTGSLRNRVLLLTVGAFLAVAAPAVYAFTSIVDATVLRLGTLFAEKQILYDRHRGLAALTREVALAETLARSPIIREWAADEFHAAKRARGIEELEHYRQAFSDRSYFFVVGGSGNYYFNDREGSHAGDQLRYTLSPDNPRDGWYYKTAASETGCQLNVDNDDNLGVTKVWINCVVSGSRGVLGILGTGIDLTTFIRTVVNTDQPGIDSMFVDRSGAVQANRDASKIDFHSLTKDTKNKKTVFQMVDREADRARLAAMMDDVRADGSTVAAEFMAIDGRQTLVGIGYLDSLGWYNVTLMDVAAIIDRRLFLPIGGLLVLIMAAVAGILTWLFRRSVLDRLARTEASIARVGEGDFSHRIDDSGSDEIARLARSVNRMAEAVHTNRDTLERAVRERTAQLEGIAYIDSLTGILNRRGTSEAFAQLRAREDVQGCAFLLVDIDRFKDTNDRFGHEAGDRIVVEVATRLLRAAGADSFCGRWGGDEFVVLAPIGDAAAVARLAARLLDAIAATPFDPTPGLMLRVTPSIGHHLAAPDEPLEDVAHKADRALYRAKREGRNRAVAYDAKLDAAGDAGMVA